MSRSKDWENRFRKTVTGHEIKDGPGDEYVVQHGEKKLVLVVEEAGVQNIVKVQGKLRDQAEWQDLGDENVLGNYQMTFDISTVEMFRVNTVHRDTTEITKYILSAFY